MAKPKSPKAEQSFQAPPILPGLMAANPVLAKAWMDAMSEGARFMTDRLQSDLEMQKALMACKTPAEFMQVQAEFMKSTMEQYAEQAKRVMTMTAKASADVSEDLKTGHRRGYDDVPV